MTFPEHNTSLQAGYRIREYEIERQLGEGGFGIVYLAKDRNLEKQVAIKEYMPSDFAVRMGGETVRPKNNQTDIEIFTWGKQAFLQEARALARFTHHNINRVLTYFEANNTAYMVLEFEAGENLKAYLDRHQCLDAELLERKLRALIHGLKTVHATGYLHRDIKPGNIILRGDGEPVLIDFGAARQLVCSKSRPVTAMITPGYAPIEQYSSKGDLGPWTDIYSLAATAYHCLTGKIPAEAVDRIRDDPLPLVQKLGIAGRPELFRAIDWALEVGEHDRPQNLDAWLKALDHGADGKQAHFSGSREPPTILPADASPSKRLTTVRDKPGKAVRQAGNWPRLVRYRMQIGGAIATAILSALIVINYPAWRKSLENYAVGQEAVRMQGDAASLFSQAEKRLNELILQAETARHKVGQIKGKQRNAKNADEKINFTIARADAEQQAWLSAEMMRQASATWEKSAFNAALQAANSALSEQRYAAARAQFETLREALQGFLAFPETLKTELEQQRRKLLITLEGKWQTAANKCANPSLWTVENNLLRAQWPNFGSFQELVMSVSEQAIETETIAPANYQGRQYRYNVKGDRLSVFDVHKNSHDVLVKCNSP
jgi:serine/threonine protein kinase